MTPGDTHTARSRDAIRILFILDQAGSAPSKDDSPGTAKILQAEKRLQALDFWVRNPDYLAHEYLEHFESSGRADAELLATAAEIMQGDEPELRRLGMLRFMFGAFEAVDTAIAKLASVGMVDVRRRFNAAGNKVTRTDYLLLSPGQALAAEIAGAATLGLVCQKGRAGCVHRRQPQRGAAEEKAIRGPGIRRPGLGTRYPADRGEGPRPARRATRPMTAASSEPFADAVARRTGATAVEVSAVFEKHGVVPSPRPPAAKSLRILRIAFSGVKQMEEGSSAPFAFDWDVSKPGLWVLARRGQPRRQVDRTASRPLGAAR